MLIPVHNTWHDRMRVGTGADDEEEDEEEGLEVEEGGLHLSQFMALAGQPTFHH